MDELALWVGSELKCKDPIVEVEAADIRNFEGGLFFVEERNGWVLLYNQSLQSAGRIRFTKAHELGHYLLHRKNQDSFECTQADMVRWGPKEKVMEYQADEFASNLLIRWLSPNSET